MDHELAAIVKLSKPAPPTHPWGDIRSVDHWSAEERVSAIYERAHLKPPAFSWCQSPASMFRAHSLLREFQTQTRQAMIEALVPRTNPVETDAKQAMLTAMLDKDRTVTVGAPVGNMLNLSMHGLWENLFATMPPINGSFTTSQNRMGTPATMSDALIFPGEYSEFIGLCDSSTFCMLPYMKLCWMCLPPVMTKQDAFGHLHAEDGPALKFSDGFEVFARYVEPDVLTEGEYVLDEGDMPQLPAHED